jgi:hypothetical protein
VRFDLKLEQELGRSIRKGLHHGIAGFSTHSTEMEQIENILVASDPEN